MLLTKRKDKRSLWQTEKIKINDARGRQIKEDARQDKKRKLVINQKEMLVILKDKKKKHVAEADKRKRNVSCNK